MSRDEVIEENNSKEEIVKEEPQLKNVEKQEEPIRELKNEEFKVSGIYVEKSKKTVIVVMCIIFLLAVLVLSMGFAIINMCNQNIVVGISIRGIEVSGLTEKQASEKVLEMLNAELDKEININIDGEIYSISPKQIEVDFDVENATETAHKIGKVGNIFVNNYEILEAMLKKKDIELNMSYDEEALEDLLIGINAKLPNAVMDYIYSVEGNELIITKGTAGKAINIEEAKEIIIKQIETGNYKSVELKVEHREPKEINIQEIYDEVYTEPKDAYFVKDPFELFPHENGIDFDIEKAKEILKEDKEEYVIDLEIIKPDILTNDLGTEALSDMLSYCSTRYDEANTPRTTNLRLATQKINGVMVMPGETFSYNKTLGKRTAAAGYKEAAGYAGGKVVQMVGGGICQVSSTLYDAVVYANLEIVERHNHMFITSYASAGEDATVSYGALDFKFKNNREYPILIKATAKGGVSRVEIYGIKEENEYDIEIYTKVLSYTPFSVVYEDDDTLEAGKEKVSQYGANGCKSKTYKIVKLNGVEQSREVLSTDTYSPMNKIIKRGTKVTTPPEEIVDTDTNPVEPEEEQTATIPTIEPENTNNNENTEDTEDKEEKIEETQPEVTPTTPAEPEIVVPEPEEPVATPTEPAPETTTLSNSGEIANE